MHHLDVLNGPWVKEPLSSSSSLLLKPIEARPVGWHALTKTDCGVRPWHALRSSIRAWKLIRAHHSLYSMVFREGMRLLSCEAWWKHKPSSLGCFSVKPASHLSVRADFWYLHIGQVKLVTFTKLSFFFFCQVCLPGLNLCIIHTYGTFFIWSDCVLHCTKENIS